jgi:AcrR family transcriptional regulator
MLSSGSLRERLIDVGVELVMAGAVGSVGLREVAREAGVSHGTPRRYFPTHKALLSAIASRGFADLGARFTAAVDGIASPRARLEAIGRAHVRFAMERRGMFELMFRDDLLDSDVHGPDGPRLRESTLPLFGLIVELVSRCRVQGDPRVTAAALWANLHGIAQLWTWKSLPLVLDSSGDDPLDQIVAAALKAHLGPVTR